MAQIYRINAKIRRHHEAALDSNRVEFKSEDYDDDESLCMAIASELLEMLQADREYLESLEGEEDEHSTQES